MQTANQTEAVRSELQEPAEESVVRGILVSVLDACNPGSPEKPRTTVANLRKAGFQVSVNHLRYGDEDAKEIMEKRELVGGPAYNTNLLQNMHELRESRKDGLFPLNGNYISPKGGMTKVSVKTPLDEEFTAEANCCLVDMYNRRMGVNLCMRRIFEKMLKHYHYSKGQVKDLALEMEAAEAVQMVESIKA